MKHFLVLTGEGYAFTGGLFVKSITQNVMDDIKKFWWVSVGRKQSMFLLAMQMLYFRRKIYGSFICQMAVVASTVVSVL